MYYKLFLLAYISITTLLNVDSLFNLTNILLLLHYNLVNNDIIKSLKNEKCNSNSTSLNNHISLKKLIFIFIYILKPLSTHIHYNVFRLIGMHLYLYVFGYCIYYTHL